MRMNIFLIVLKSERIVEERNNQSINTTIIRDKNNKINVIYLYK